MDMKIVDSLGLLLLVVVVAMGGTGRNGGRS